LARLAVACEKYAIESGGRCSRPNIWLETTAERSQLINNASPIFNAICNKAEKKTKKISPINSR
jgi:hypothetical protein